MPLGERPPLVVYLEAPEPHIRMLWGTQFVTLSFAQPTPEDGKGLAFAQYIHLRLLPATVVVQSKWLDPEEVTVLWATEMEALIVRLALGYPWLPADTPRPERVSVPRSSLAPLSLVQPLIVSPFLSPATSWHMMHTKSDAVSMK